MGHDGLATLLNSGRHRCRLRTANAIELVNREIKRRPRVAKLLPTEASCI